MLIMLFLIMQIIITIACITIVICHRNVKKSIPRHAVNIGIYRNVRCINVFKPTYTQIIINFRACLLLIECKILQLLLAQ